jgi:hypothetical protein
MKILNYYINSTVPQNKKQLFKKQHHTETTQTNVSMGGINKGEKLK